MTEIIDANSHIITTPVLDAIDEAHPSDEASSLRTAPRMSAIDERVDYLDRHGIDRQVINLAAPMVWSGADPEAVVDIARLANDEVRRVADAHPDRFIPTGTLPFLTGEYVDEARRCVEELGFRGLQIWSNVDGTLLDHADFEPFWETVDDLGVPVWIHPQLHSWHDWGEGETWIYKMAGWPFDTTIAVARLLFFGTLERHRNVRLVTHHLGGNLPFIVGRFKSWYRTRQEEPELYDNPRMADLSEPLDTYFERIYGDTAVSGDGETYPLQCGYEFFGADNVVYSADYPFGPDRGEYWAEIIIPAIESMDLPEADKERIFSGNVKRLLDL